MDTRQFRSWWCRWRVDFIALAVTATLVNSLFGWPWDWAV